MPESRPSIPAALRRRVLVEAGHRCAIPTCRTIPVELAHIEPWAKVREHTFDNLIALCPTCHARFDRGDIDRTSMRQYKVNLGVVVHRYNDIERRVLESLGNRTGDVDWIVLPWAMSVTYQYLLDDGMLEELDVEDAYFHIDGIRIGTNRRFKLSPKGAAFVEHWFGAQPLDEAAGAATNDPGQP